MKFSLFSIFCTVLLISGCSADVPDILQEDPIQEEEVSHSPSEIYTADLPLDQIELPEGFRISVFSDEVPNARSLAVSEKGTVFVSTRQLQNVYALRDEDHDGRAESMFIIADDLQTPNGLALLDGDLYVAQVNRVLKFENIDDNLENPPEPLVVSDGFPKDVHHGWKFIRFGPDGKLYVPVGAPCNVCEKEDERYSSIMRMNPDGTELELFASGIRNTVGFDWHPTTDELWFTDNGRDLMGDDIPPDELNRAPEKGMHFGFPYCHGGDIPDPAFGQKRSCDEFTAPSWNLNAHVAALGMRFYTGDAFPDEYAQQIFVAEHGSWNRSKKDGYRVMLAQLDGNKVLSYEPFAQGWLQGQQAWGRPVDVLNMPDGSLLVSDDLAGVVYRIFYEL